MPRDRRLVIGFAGQSGVGKTTGAQYLAERYNFRYLRYSKVLAEWKSTGSSKDALRKTGWEVMSSGSQLELNRRLIRSVKPGFDYSIDGLRHPIDETSLSESFNPAFFLLYIESSSTLRCERLLSAGRFACVAEFLAADRHPVELPVLELRSRAFKSVQNNVSIDSYKAALDKILHEVEEVLGER